MLSNSPRMLFVHAHPDDETITTGATIAYYVQLGVEVCVITCTLGEEGEVIDNTYAQLISNQSNQLGGYRICELTKALNILGVNKIHFLGGAGKWRDSGINIKIQKNGYYNFISGNVNEAIQSLTNIIKELKPHVVVTYDPNGGYGHFDHKQTHNITTRAIIAAKNVWFVHKFYWVTMPYASMKIKLQQIGQIPENWLQNNMKSTSSEYIDKSISSVINGKKQLSLKINAMRIYSTQITISPNGKFYKLSNDIPLPIMSKEYYILVSGNPGKLNSYGLEDDLLSGINV